jgi:hypothetical protein
MVTHAVATKALTKLLGLRYKIIYKLRKENGAADAPTRSQGTPELAVVTASVPIWLTQVPQSNNGDQ